MIKNALSGIALMFIGALSWTFVLVAIEQNDNGWFERHACNGG